MLAVALGNQNVPLHPFVGHEKAYEVRQLAILFLVVFLHYLFNNVVFCCVFLLTYETHINSFVDNALLFFAEKNMNLFLA